MQLLSHIALSRDFFKNSLIDLGLVCLRVEHSSSLLLRFGTFFSNLVAIGRSHLLHVARVGEVSRLRHVLLQSNFAGLSKSVQSVHCLIDLASFAVVRRLFDCVVDFLRILVDENSEHLLSVGFLTVFSLGFSVDDNFLSSHGLRSLHHLLRHRVVQLLHVTISSDEHLLGHDLLLLCLVGETLGVEELVLESRLATELAHHTGINKNWCGIHHHCLLTVLSWSTELRLHGILVITLSGHDVLLHLTTIHHGRCH